ncbi:M3 family metallopeptidase [Ostreibacterium oceani]|uniref:oligopeptidase A n=1 Tax=Ostreibacterium oceani TaxID=2654998 RepID=A0A6N7F1Z4_9GAMM|nr:M3 family metallopeptidase [Ostreibacterium oceani]MPV85886.1 oligopeptidase A [Ostreibacterium oceani]
MKTNPLLTTEQFPNYSAILPEHALPAITQLCQDSKKRIAELAEQSPATWATYEAIEAIDNQLAKAWTPISHLHSVNNTQPWRQAYQDCQQILSKYSAEMSQHTGLYRFYQALQASNDFSAYDTARQKLINDAIRDFELSGVNLSDEDKNTYQGLVQQSSELYTTFSNNVLDATQAFHLHLTDEADLAGIPESAKALYRQLAAQQAVDGFWLTLDFPSYVPAITYADNRHLRETLYNAFVTRASDQGPHANQFDNHNVVEAILSTRADIATLLGFDNYAALSLANKMAKSADEVLDFLYDLVERAKPIAENEFAELKAFAQANLGLETLAPWDVAYASEKLKEAEYAISQEQLREYFPVPHVMQGMLGITEHLFGVSFSQNNEINTWHPDVTCYTVLDADKTPIAYFCMDLYARQGKNAGAWMNGAIDKIHSSHIQQLPVAYLTCNFIPPVGDAPAYLSHDEILTLFHEFGHGIHHMLTEINHSAISGINGVEWDAVELPSQFMENFCYQKTVLTDMSCHQTTSEPLPDALFDKLIAAKNFHAALMMLRQLEFSIFDMRLHHEYNSDNPVDVMTVLHAVREQVAVTPSADYARFPMSFSHIFSGGYAAGYFSYKWAEILSADAFSRFEEEGVYNTDVGEAFKREILARGASRSAMENFIAFRGRKPTIDALLRHHGMNTQTPAG